MPFKSEAQRRKFAELVSQGKMSQATYDEWSKDSPADLPDRVSKKSEPQKSVWATMRPRSIEELRNIAKKKLK